MTRLDSYSAAIEDVIVLIRSGRVGMALTVLEGLTGLVDGELMAAMAAGHAMGRRGEPLLGGKKALKRPRTPRRHEWLAERIRDPALRERAKEALRLNDELLDRVASGGVGLSPGSWRKLRKELGR
jgi:hypothetical protein